MMKQFPVLLTALLAATFVAAGFAFPGKEKDKFSKKFLKGYQQISPSTYLKLHKAGPKVDSAGTGGVVFVKLKLIDHRDSVISDLNRQDPRQSFPVRIDKPRFKGDFMDAMAHLNTGDSATFYIALDSIKKYYRANGQDEFPLEPKYDSIPFIGFRIKIDSVYSKTVFDLKMLQMQMQQQQQKKGMLDKSKQDVLWYLAVHEMSDLQPDSKGIYYKELSPGNGVQVMPGMRVSVRYKGMLTNGMIFDTNMGIPARPNLEFTAGDQMIPGFTDCILRMKDGGKAIFVIPPDLAYGEQQNGAIPAYSALVFQVELKIISTGK
jgi:FKBP-type peptidyl-prolyl cis-trans isomerase FkpA